MSAREPLHALELRVLEGPQNGAKAPLAAGVGCVLAADPQGRADGADVVLREAGAKPVRVRVTADLRDALLEVLEGEVQLGGQALRAGEQAPWAMHAPLKVGRSVLAFGRAVLPDWPLAAGSAAPAVRTETKPAAAAPRRRPLRRRAEVWLATMGGAVLAVCGAAFWTAHLAAAPRTEPVVAPPLATALKASEFSTLQLGQRADGGVELRGRLGTEGDRARLDAWLADRQVKADVAVQVDESLAREVTEVFRVNGISVQAKVNGAGSVVAEAAESDAGRLARAEEVVRRDVRGLEKLVVRNTVAPQAKPLPPLPDEPGKRIASLVAGEPAYVVTADGSRYFVGALLPSGHRITQIAAHSVALERDGQASTLNF